MPPVSAASQLQAEPPAQSISPETPPEAPETPEAPEAPETPEEPSFGSAKDPDLASAFEAEDKLGTPEVEEEEPEQPEEPQEPEPEKKEDRPPIEDDPRMPKQLRERVKEQNRQLAELQKQLETMKASPREPDAKVLEAKDKQIETLQSELSALKFEASPEYKKNYETPFNKAAGRARTLIKGLEVIEEDNNGMQSTRPADWQRDFVSIYQAEKAGEMISEAQRKFGPAAPLVIAEIQKLQELEQNMTEALETEKTEWKERGEKRTAERRKIEERNAQVWMKANEDIASKHPEWFEHSEDDKDAPELLKTTTQLADRYFNERFGKLSAEDQILLEAQMRQRFIALPMVMRRFKALKAQNEKLQKKLSGYEMSDPTRETKRTGGGAPKPDTDITKALRPLLEQAFE